jgi:hypothetical protein
MVWPIGFQTDFALTAAILESYLNAYRFSVDHLTPNYSLETTESQRNRHDSDRFFGLLLGAD